MGSKRKLSNQLRKHRNPYVNPMHSRNGSILGANGAPTKINVSVQYSPGPLATPAVLPPINAGDAFVAPVFGGATRMEAVASRLLARAMDHHTLARCSEDTDYRRQLIEASVLTAWELIGAAGSYSPGAQSDGENPPSAEAASEANQAEDGREPEKPSRIVLPD